MTPQLVQKAFVLLLAASALITGRVWPAGAPPVDGVAVSIHSEQGKKGEAIHCHDLKDGKTAANRVLYRTDDRIISACISPFGNQIAFIMPGGTVATVGTDGEGLNELVDDALWVQWPASDGGRWVYYLDARDKCTLRRVNVKTGTAQPVVTLDRTIESAALSLDASPSSGWLVFPGGDSNAYAALYPLARGTGATWAVPEWWQLRMGPYQRLCFSPDGTVFGMLAPDGTFLVIGIPANDDALCGYRLDPVNYRNRPADWYHRVEWRFNDLVGPHELKAMFRIEERLRQERARYGQPVWAVNHPGWVLFARLNYAESPDLSKKPTSSDLVLWDVAAGAHHGIPSHADVTENAVGAFERPVGFWQWRPAQFSLGLHRGEAPFTVTFDDARLQAEMTWDFGDGSPRVKGKTATHTYTKDGNFTVVAEKGAWAKPLREHVTTPGEGLYFAKVAVLPRAPVEARAHYVDATHLLVEFDEPVQARDATVELSGKVKVKEWDWVDSGRRMAIELAAPLERPDTLRLKGIQDLAQQPNGLRDDTVRVLIPAWPTDRRNLVFLWEDASQCNAIYHRADGRIRLMELMHDAADSGIDRFGRLKLGHGGFRGNLRLQNRMGSGDLADIVLNSTFSFECTIQPENLTQRALRRPPRIVTLSSHRVFVSLFMIGQQADRLLVSIKTDDNWIEDMGQPLHGDRFKHPKPEEREGFGPYFYGHGPWVEVATLAGTETRHLVVTYQPGRMLTYLDGEKVYDTDRVTGYLNWGWGMLVLGGHHGLSGSSDCWRGTMEGVALYSRVLPPDEIKRNYQAYARKLRERPMASGEVGTPEGAR